jgi:hypothetical protein
MDSFIAPEILKDFPVFYGIAITIALITIALKSISALISFYEDVLLRRFFNRLKYLSEHAEENSDTLDYLKALKRNEIFRMVSGIKSYPEKSQMLMKIFNLGIADNKELKSIKDYLKPKKLKVEITLNKFDKFQIIYSFVAGLFMMTVGVLYALSLQFGSAGQSLAGFFIMFVFMLIGGIILKDHRKYKVLTRVYKQLENQGELIEGNSDISLFNLRKTKP